MKNFPNYSKKVLAILLIIGFFLPFMPKPANAVLGVGDVVIVAGDTSPTGINNFINHTLQHLKDYVLDHLLVVIAKQYLHKMTADVVDWINGGLEGNPAFLTNPQGFFLDTADQITGEFIANNGALSGLCSPFSLDLRINLALTQTSQLKQRYQCTLSTVIKNAQNAHLGATVGNSPNGMTLGDIIHGNVSDNPNAISVNGASIDDTGDFLGGNFGVGGWPAFVALTTEPPNNQYGAYLQARSDLRPRIAEKQTVVNTDLNRGNGFMSWQKCDVIGTADEASSADIARLNNQTEFDPTVSIEHKTDGTLVYKSCTTQTPGSVVSSQLQKSLNVPADELELANDMNAVINALMTKMISTLTTKGLGALSSTGSNVSFTAQLRTQTDQMVSQSITQAQTQTSALTGDAETTLNGYKSSYVQAVNAVTDNKNKLVAAKACFSAKLNAPGPTTVGPAESGYAQGQITQIDAEVSSTVDPMIEALTTKRQNIDLQLTQLKGLQNLSGSHLNSSDDIRNQQNNFQIAIEQAARINADASNASGQVQQDVSNAQTQAQKFSLDASKYQTACDGFPNNIGWSGI